MARMVITLSGIRKGRLRSANGNRQMQRITFRLFEGISLGSRIALFREAHLRTILTIAMISLFVAPAARAQTLVDPAKVAPEYREAAEKRRAEQLQQRECGRKADADKVLRRDRTAYLNHCLEAAAAKH
jgi:hypothetical protein